MPSYKGFNIPDWVFEELNKKQKDELNSMQKKAFALKVKQTADLLKGKGVLVETSSETKKEQPLESWKAARKLREIVNTYDFHHYKMLQAEKTVETNSRILLLEQTISGKKVTEIRLALAELRRALENERTFAITGASSPLGILQEVKRYSNHLVTLPNSPLTQDANTLRAIRAILKNNEGATNGETETTPEPVGGPIEPPETEPYSSLHSGGITFVIDETTPPTSIDITSSGTGEEP